MNNGMNAIEKVVELGVSLFINEKTMQINRLCMLASFLICAGLCSSLTGETLQIDNATGQSLQPHKYVVNDYDGDGISDLAIYSESQGLVSIYSLTKGLICSNFHFGGPGWMPFPGDFNGDGYCDLAMYNYTSGDWYILINRTWQVLTGQMGGKGFVPAIGDYDGDGVSDVGVYNVFTAKWYVSSPTKGVLYWDIPFGEPYPDSKFDPHLDFPSIPIAADFDGDGKADPALYVNKFSNDAFQTYPSGWWVLFSRTKTINYVLAPYVPDFPNYTDYESVLLDNNGDGVFELSVNLEADNLFTVTGDYNGDGKYEIASHSPSYSGVWVINLGQDPYGPGRTEFFGSPTFIPVTEPCLRYDKCIWGALYDTNCYGRHYAANGTHTWAGLYFFNHKVSASYGNRMHLQYSGSGGILEDEIWLMSDRDTFSTGNISRGSLSHNPIIIYDYSNGEKTGSYWEFYR